MPQQTPGLGLCILSYLISWTFCFTLGFFKTGFLLHTFEDFYSLVFVLTILNAFCNENVLKFGHSETEKKNYQFFETEKKNYQFLLHHVSHTCTSDI